MSIKEKIEYRFNTIYKGNYDKSLVNELAEKIEYVKSQTTPTTQKWTEKDIILITYGDSIQQTETVSLEVLNNFIHFNFSDLFTIIHILPFFPYSSDDGFSVIDYKSVDPKLGSWKNIQELSQDYRIMGDLVINHISQESIWFRNYLQDKEPGKNYFIEAEPTADLSMVVRPRSLPLLTPVKSINGEKFVWTTFSADQVDLNFGNPVLLAQMIEIFLFYLQKGVSVIRLDAIAYLWKENGTNCIHLPETHEIVKLLRDITDYIDLSIIIITETNVPNKENLSYFGVNDEAHMVYNFSLPPLILYTLYSGDSSYLSEWAASLPQMVNNCTFLNFTASHDGIGVRPLEGILPEKEFSQLVESIKNSGGFVNTRRNTEGKDIPYELNITFFDALKTTKHGIDSFQVERFICSQVIMCTLQGIPAFYINSLFAGENFFEGVKKTGMNRTINRQKWERNQLQDELSSDTLRFVVYSKLKKLINIRKQLDEFHPEAAQKVIFVNNSLFIVKRGSSLVSISNICEREQLVLLENFFINPVCIFDLISEQVVESNYHLKPYQTIWLKEKNS